MKEEKAEETFFNELMSKSKLKFPFPDFEDNVMRLVQSNQKERTNIKRDLRLSWIFFLIGSIFGITISIILPKFLESSYGLSIDTITITFQIVFIFLFVTQLNYLIDIYKKTNRTKR